jgi:hypothetical protein
MILTLKHLDDYDRLTDLTRPFVRGLPIYSLTDRRETGIVDVLFSHSISTLYNSLWYMPKYRMNLYYRRHLQKA